jgi:hypothetical protein
MALILDDFREYLDFYLRDYLGSEHLDWTQPDWVQVLERVINLGEKEARILYLQYFLWAKNGEFLRFNDETKSFVSELEQLAGIDFATVRTEPAAPLFEDLIHFIGNFID